MATTTIPNPALETHKNVGGVEYIIRSFFKEEARETAEQKILRLVKQCVAAEINNTDTSVLSSR